MRVTNNMLVRNLISNVNTNLNKMQKMQDQLATGKRVQTASDDPVAASKIIKYRTDNSELEQYGTNTTDALSWLESTESTMRNVVGVLQRARELTVQAANGINSEIETNNIAKEIKQLKDELITNANFTFAGRYIFSGFHTDKKFLNKDGTFNVDITDNDINNKPSTIYQIGIGEDMKISTNGLNIFGYVRETGNFVNKMPSNKTKGNASTKSNLTSDNEINLTQDYTTSPFTVDIGGTTYTVDTTALDGSVSYPIEKKDFLNALINADDGAGTKLSDVANVFFNTDNKLVIEPKSYGNITESITSVPAIAATYTAGTNVVEASVSGSLIFDSDVSNEFDYKSFMLTVNGETKKVTLGVVSPQTVAGLVAELNTAITNASFSSSVVVTGANGGNLTFNTALSSNDGSVPSIEVRPIKSKKSQLIKDFDDVIDSLELNDQKKIGNFIETLDAHINTVLTELADVGAKTNRMDLVRNRIDENSVSITKLLSDAQDADMSEVIMWLKNSENVYRASLSTGSRVIQPSLIDFLR